MSENFISQSVLFQSEFVKPVLAVFNQPASGSDRGPLLLRLQDDRLRLTSTVAGALADSREVSALRHSLLSVVLQRAFGIGGGYEDANDAARLRHDAAHQLLLGRCPDAGSELASPPTISRVENACDEERVNPVSRAFSSAVIARHQRRLGKKIGALSSMWTPPGTKRTVSSRAPCFTASTATTASCCHSRRSSGSVTSASSTWSLPMLRPANAGNAQVLGFLPGVMVATYSSADSFSPSSP